MFIVINHKHVLFGEKRTRKKKFLIWMNNFLYIIDSWSSSLTEFNRIKMNMLIIFRGIFIEFQWIKRRKTLVFTNDDEVKIKKKSFDKSFSLFSFFWLMILFLFFFWPKYIWKCMENDDDHHHSILSRNFIIIESFSFFLSLGKNRETKNSTWFLFGSSWWWFKKHHKHSFTKENNFRNGIFVFLSGLFLFYFWVFGFCKRIIFLLGTNHNDKNFFFCLFQISE